MERMIFNKVLELTVLNKSLGSNNSFKWKVGNELSAGRDENGKDRRVVCTRIIQDINSYYLDGQNRWLVYVKAVGGETEMVLAAYENAMVEIKMDVSELFSL